MGWPHRPLAKVETALANSFLTSCLLLRITQAGSEPEPDELIGLARATSDHVFNATIWDVLVDPDYQVLGALAGALEIDSYRNSRRLQVLCNGQPHIKQASADACILVLCYCK